MNSHSLQIVIPMNVNRSEKRTIDSNDITSGRSQEKEKLLDTDDSQIDFFKRRKTSIYASISSLQPILPRLPSIKLVTEVIPPVLKTTDVIPLVVEITEDVPPVLETTEDVPLIVETTEVIATGIVPLAVSATDVFSTGVVPPAVSATDVFSTGVVPPAVSPTNRVSARIVDPVINPIVMLQSYLSYDQIMNLDKSLVKTIIEVDPAFDTIKRITEGKISTIDFLLWMSFLKNMRNIHYIFVLYGMSFDFLEDNMKQMDFIVINVEENLDKNIYKWLFTFCCRIDCQIPDSIMKFYENPMILLESKKYHDFIRIAKRNNFNPNDVLPYRKIGTAQYPDINTIPASNTSNNSNVSNDDMESSLILSSDYAAIIKHCSETKSIEMIRRLKEECLWDFFIHVKKRIDDFNIILGVPIKNTDVMGIVFSTSKENIKKVEKDLDTLISRSTSQISRKNDFDTELKNRDFYNKYVKIILNVACSRYHYFVHPEKWLHVFSSEEHLIDQRWKYSHPDILTLFKPKTKTTIDWDTDLYWLKYITKEDPGCIIDYVKILLESKQEYLLSFIKDVLDIDTFSKVHVLRFVKIILKNSLCVVAD